VGSSHINIEDYLVPKSTGMDHSGHNMEHPGEEMDHSGHNMEHPGEEMDHSGHNMESDSPSSSEKDEHDAHQHH